MSFLYSLTKSTLHLFYRCTALQNNLKAQAGYWSHNHTHQLKQIINSKLLWDKYGIDNDIMVCQSPFLFDWSHKVIAIHSTLPSSRYLWDVITRYLASANQRNIQGPPGPMGLWLFAVNTWRETCKCCIGWYRPPVSDLDVPYLYMWCTQILNLYMIGLRPRQHFLHFDGFPKEGASSNGREMIRRHWWRSVITSQAVI